MFWKIGFFVAAIVITIVAFGSAMAVAGGGVSCTFNRPIWEACFKFAFGIIGLRIIGPALLLLGIGKLLTEANKH